MPGWQEKIFPPYFVVGAMFSGFAMVVLLAAAIRWGFGFERLLTIRHFEAMALIILASSLIMALCYAIEWFSAWYSGRRAERSEVVFAFTGSYAPMFWLQSAAIARRRRFSGYGARGGALRFWSRFPSRCWPACGWNAS
jgi:Ni/Fe-hydrogenase subunit HybB-like protein